jgi:putative glutamine amidotransferase
MRRKEAVLERTVQGEPPQVELALGLDYMRAIERAGGVPVVLPPLGPRAVAPLLDRLAGICMSGGPDLDPEAYGGSPHPDLGPIEPDVDRFELAAARGAWVREMPILAICRGAQALNVSRGGTLFQHLPDRELLTLEHRQPKQADHPTHIAEVAPGTLLASIVGEGALEVNSFHHQAVDDLGLDLQVAARSPDGVVEAIEAPGRPFALGVQWHAEALIARPPHAALFERLVQASQDYAALANARLEAI